MAHHFIMLRLNPFGRRVERKGWWFGHSVSRLRVCLSAEGAKNVSWPLLSPLRGWGSLTMEFTGKFVNVAHHFIMLRLNPFGLRVEREGWWFGHSMSYFQVCLSEEGAKNVSWPLLSPLRGWGSLTMAFTGKFVDVAHHFIMLRLNPFGLRVEREGWWCGHSMSYFQVCLSEEDAKNVSWPWLSPLLGWNSLTMAFTGKFVYICIYMYIYWK